MCTLPDFAVGDVVLIRATITASDAGDGRFGVSLDEGMREQIVYIRPRIIDRRVSRALSYGDRVRRKSYPEETGDGIVLSIKNGHAWVEWAGGRLMTVPLSNLERVA